MFNMISIYSDIFIKIAYDIFFIKCELNKAIIINYSFNYILE